MTKFEFSESEGKLLLQFFIYLSQYYCCNIYYTTSLLMSGSNIYVLLQFLTFN